MNDHSRALPQPSDKPAILIVDDEEHITRSLARSLRDQFTVYTASSAEQALEILAHEAIAVILADQRMPGVTGVELLERARDLRPESVGILVSGYTDVTALIDALNLGNVRGYIAKPWDLTDLRRRLDDAVRTYYAGFLDRTVLRQSADAVARARSQIAELQWALDLLASGRPYELFEQWEEERRAEEHRDELSSLDQVAGTGPEEPPADFNVLTDRYSELLEQALNARIYQEQLSNTPALRSISEQLGRMRCSARDVVRLHLDALKRKIPGAPPARAEAYMREGRMLLIELMGYLVNYYRGSGGAFPHRPS